MAVIRCEEFKVACAPDEESCEECVLRARALEREAERKRIEARRRAKERNGSAVQPVLRAIRICDSIDVELREAGRPTP